jgi:hypothetical protein
MAPHRRPVRPLLACISGRVLLAAAPAAAGAGPALHPARVRHLTRALADQTTTPPDGAEILTRKVTLP